jgi:hypothetical protein
VSRQTTPGGTARQVAPGPAGSAATSARWPDTLRAANDAFDADQFASARRLGQAIFSSPDAPDSLKARAAVLVATTFAQENNVDRALDWYRNALRKDPGNQRIRQAIIDLGGTP